MPLDGDERLYDPPPRPEREVPTLGELFSGVILCGLFPALGFVGLVVLLGAAARSDLISALGGFFMVALAIALPLRMSCLFFDPHRRKQWLDEASRFTRDEKG